MFRIQVCQRGIPARAESELPMSTLLGDGVSAAATIDGHAADGDVDDDGIDAVDGDVDDDGIDLADGDVDDDGIDAVDGDVDDDGIDLANGDVDDDGIGLEVASFSVFK